MWPCLGWHGHCRAIGPVGTARHDFCLIVPCLGHHHGTLALSGTARRAAVPAVPVPSRAVPCCARARAVPCRAARLENYIAGTERVGRRAVPVRGRAGGWTHRVEQAIALNSAGRWSVVIRICNCNPLLIMNCSSG